MNHEDRWLVLVAALAGAVPESRTWDRQHPDPAGPGESWLEVASPSRPGTQRLIVRLRPDGDVQVEYHVLDRPGTPFEALFPVPDGEEAAISLAVADFVSALLQERVVLAYARGRIGGGRRFPTLEDLATEKRTRFAWVTSWRGTYDRDA